MGKYITRANLENRLTVETVLRLYDDGTGNVDDDALNEIIDDAEAEVDSYILGTYSEPLPNTADRLVKRAALDFLIAFSFDKHPEYVRMYGEEPRAAGAFDRGTARMQRIAKALQRLPDQNTPPTTPANVGGDTTSVADDPNFPTPPGSVFIKTMGDY